MKAKGIHTMKTGTKTDFSARSYFACHIPHDWHRTPPVPRQLDARQMRILNAAMRKIRNGMPVGMAVAWAGKEARR